MVLLVVMITDKKYNNSSLSLFFRHLWISNGRKRYKKGIKKYNPYLTF